MVATLDNKDEAVALANEPTSINIVIVDDHPLFRGAMVQALNTRLPDVDGTINISEAEDFASLQQLLKGTSDIDLVLLDLAMPGVSGFSGLLTLRAEYADVPVVIVSASDDQATVNRALSLGASGFVPKSAGIEIIRTAISCVLQGDIWKPQDVENFVEPDAEIAELIGQLSSLTPQQTRVLSMISQGLLNKQIAYELGVSEATVKAHVSAVLQKLKVDSRTQAVIRLSRLGADALTMN
ncbi:MAG: DNA-binding response regulator [Hyphomicrobiales bacterium]|nr:MAG: DNA-binding response regulator [Hyphomicrobiales bacterium]